VIEQRTPVCEYLLSVSINSSMMHDKKIIGVCGETELANAKQSLITMMQVIWLALSDRRRCA
jgi:chitin synthase